MRIHHELRTTSSWNLISIRNVHVHGQATGSNILCEYDPKTTWKVTQIRFIKAQGPTYLHNEKKEKGNIFLFTLEPRASGIGSKLRDAASWTFSHKYRSYSLCTNKFNCARLRSEAEIGKYHCAGSTRRCWQGSRRKKWEKWHLAPATTVVHNSREPCTVFIRGGPVFGRPWVRTMDYQWSKGCPYQDSPSSAVSS